MAVSGRRSGGRGVCQPLATWGCNGHAVNDTILAHAQLLVDAPERIGPIQAIGMDSQPRLPLKSEGPQKTTPAIEDLSFRL